MTGEIIRPDTAWQRAAEAGERTVREALRGRIARRLERGDNPVNALAVLLGGLTACAREIRVAVDPDTNRAELEANVMAMVRGALRGAEGPLNEDWTHYGEW